ncbi:MAG: DUF5916 domain-containing protein, partial [Bacteroidota bacterium]
TALDPRVGGDVKVGLTGGLTLSGTVNPDFGQVEADPAQVNLTGFELFFEERRPFFLEGLETFSLAPRRFTNNRRPELLYTRRIGRAPQRSSFVPSTVTSAVGDGGAVFTDTPRQTTILGAAKVSGQVGRFTVGVLNATTRSEFGDYQAFDAEGRAVGEGRVQVEPLSNYLVARARGTFGPAIVGGLLTSVVRDTDEPGVAELLPRTATVAGLDIEQRVSEQWLFTGQVAGSAVTGSEQAIERVQRAFPRLYQRPDAESFTLDATRTALQGWTAEAHLLKTDGDHWIGSIHAAATSPGFEANDLGFQSRADYTNVDGFVSYRQNEPNDTFNFWRVNAFSGTGWNFDGDLIRAIAGGSFEGQFRNFWSVRLYTDAVPRYLEDRLTRGGPVALRDAGAFFSVNVDSDSRRDVVGSLGARIVGNELGRIGTGGSIQIEARPRPELFVSVAPALTVVREPRQYITAFDDAAAVSTFGRRYVFGQLDDTTLSLEARLDWTFAADVSLQLFLRPFVSRGQFSSFKAFDRPRAFRLPRYGVDVGTVTANDDGSTTIDPGDGGDTFTVDPDFTVRSLQGNAVFRWEYRPGSTFFLVWQQQRNGFASDGQLQAGRDVSGLFTDPATNVFLVKMSYWLG